MGLLESALKGAAWSRERVTSPVLLFTMLVVCLVPIWQNRFLPLYDYQTHLLEAQVVMHQSEPAYSEFYDIRPGWYLQSNALVTLMLVGLGKWMTVDEAGRIVVSGYLLLLGTGWYALLAVTKRPPWLMVIFPLLAFNLTFTSGLLNWCYGFALLIYLLVIYLKWQQNQRQVLIFVIAGLSILIYTFHLMAWGLALLILLVLAAGQRMELRRYLALVIALASPLPLLLLTRPVGALFVPASAIGIWVAAAAIRKYRLTPVQVSAIGAFFALGFLAAVKFGDAWVDKLDPEISYSMYARLFFIPRVFTLPHHALPFRPEISAYNVSVLILLPLLVAAAYFQTTRSKRDPAAEPSAWLAVLGMLLLVYAVIPTQTADIVGTEPRVLLLIFVVILLAMRFDLKRDRIWSMVGITVLTLGLFSSLAINVFVYHYNQSAQSWAAALDQIPPAQKILVLPDPRVLSKGGWSSFLQVAHVFEPDQFTSTYAIRHGGFVSNTFFNGPLLPPKSEAIPPYWYAGFRSPPYVQARCKQIRQDYDLVLVWTPESEGLLRELENCYGPPVVWSEDLGIWR